MPKDYFELKEIEKPQTQRELLPSPICLKAEYKFPYCKENFPL